MDLKDILNINSSNNESVNIDLSQAGASTAVNVMTGRDDGFFDDAKQNLTSLAYSPYTIAKGVGEAFGKDLTVNKWEGNQIQNQGLNMLDGKVMTDPLHEFFVEGSSYALGGIGLLKGTKELAKGAIESTFKSQAKKQSDEISKLVARPDSFFKKAGKEINEDIIGGSLLQPMMGIDTQMSSTGRISDNREDVMQSRNYVEGVMSEALGDGMFYGAGAAVGTGIIKNTSNVKLNRKFKNAEAIELGNDSLDMNEVVSTVNEPFFAAKNQIANDIANGVATPEQQAFHDGILDGINNQDGTKNTPFLRVDSLDNLPAAVRENNAYAVIDDTNNFEISTPALGLIKGHINDSGRYIVDKEASDLSLNAMKMKIGKSRLLNVLDTDPSSTATSSDTDSTREYTDILGSAIVRSDNTIEPASNAYFANPAQDMKIENYTTPIDENNRVQGDMSLGRTILTSNREDVNDGQVATTDSGKRIVKLLNAAHSGKTSSIVSAIVQSIGDALLNKSTDATNQSSPDLLKRLFNLQSDLKKSGVTNDITRLVKKQFENALKVATVIEFSKLNIEPNQDTGTYNISENESTKGIEGKILKTALRDVLGIKTSEVDALVNTLDIQRPLSDVIQNAYTPVENTDFGMTENKLSLNDAFGSLINALGSTRTTKENFVRDLKKGLDETTKNVHYDTEGNTSGRVRNTAGIRKDSNVFKHSVDMANKKFMIDSELLASFRNAFHNLKKGKDNGYIAKYFKDVIPESHLESKKALQEFIDDIENQLNEIKLLEDSNGYDGIYTFDVDIASNTRSIYADVIHPQSKIGRYIFKGVVKSTDYSFKISQTTNYDLIVGYYNSVFDTAHSNIDEVLKDYKSVTEEITEISKGTKKDKARVDDLEKLILISQIGAQISSLKAKVPVNFTVGVDSISNQVAIVNSMLSIFDNAIGFLSKGNKIDPNKSNDLNSKVKNELMRLFPGSEFSRAEAKTLVIPFLYESSLKGMAESLAIAIIDKALKVPSVTRLSTLPQAIINKFEKDNILIKDKVKRYKEILKDIKETQESIRDKDSFSQKTQTDQNSVKEKLRNLAEQQTKYKEDQDVHQYMLVEGFLKNEFDESIKDPLDKFKALMTNYIMESNIPKVIQDSVLPPHIIKLMEQFGKVLKIKEYQLTSALIKKDINSTQALKIVNAVISQTMKDGVSQDMRNSINREFNDNGEARYSIEYIIEVLGKHAQLDSKSIMGVEAISSRMPKIVNPFGDDIPLGSMLGNKSYIGDKGIVTPNYTYSGLSFALFVQSIDSSIASIAGFGKQGIDMFDAVYGQDNVKDTAKKGNELLLDLFKNFNPYDYLNTLLPNEIGTISKEGLYQYFKDTNLRNDNKTLPNDADITSVYDSLRENIASLRVEFDSLVGEVNTRMQQDATINNYTDRTDTFSVSSVGQSSIDYSRNSKKMEPFRGESIDIFKALKNIIYKVDSTNPILYFINDGINTMPSTLIDRDINIVFKDGVKSEHALTKDKIETITIGHSSFSIQALNDIIHEAIHASIRRGKDLEVRSKIQDVIDFIKSKYESDSIVVRNAGSETSLKKGVADEEIFTGIIERLASNSILLNNKSFFSKKLNTNDLSIAAETIVIDGKEISTLQEFEYYLKSEVDKNYDRSDLASSFKSVTRDLSTVMNNGKIKDFVNGTNMFKDRTMKFAVNESEAFITAKVLDMKQLSEIKSKINGLISDSSLFEIFEVNESRETVEKALSYQKHLEALIESTTSSYIKGLEQDVKKYLKGMTKEEIEKLDVDIGKSIARGVAVFKNIFLNKSINTAEQFISEIDIEIAQKKKDIIETINASNLTNEEKNNAKDVFRQYLSTLEGIASGNKYNSTFHVSDKFLTEMQKATGGKLFDKNLLSVRKYEAISEQIIAAKMLGDSVKSKSLGRLFTKMEDSSVRDFIAQSIAKFETHKNNSTLFGVNPEYSLKGTNRSVAVVDESKREKFKDSIIGETVVNGQKLYFVASSKSSYFIGEQKSQIVDFDIEEFEKGVLTGKYKGEKVFLYPNQITGGTKLTKEVINFAMSNQMSRNFYVNLHDMYSKEVLFKQYQTLKDQGILITRKQYNAIEEKGGNVDNLVKINKSHPLARAAGGILYYNKKYDAYFLGSKGINVDDITSFAGKKLGKQLSSIIRWYIDATKGIKGTYLSYFPGAFINNFAGNMLSFLTQTPSIMHAGSDLMQARKDMKEFRALITDFSKALESGDNAKIYAAKSTMESHQLFTAYEHGVFSTIRTDAYTTRSYKDLSIIGDLNRSGKNGKEMANLLKLVFADPSTKSGQFMGSYFDATEIVPKVALYYSLLRENKDAELSAQTVLMKFATYNNLHPVLNAIDQVFPFSKFAANVPKMVLFSLMTSPLRLGAVNALFPLLVMASWSDDEDKKKFKTIYEDGDFVKLPYVDAAYYIGSMNNLDIMNIFATSNKLGETPFLPSFTSSLLTRGPEVFIPGTSLGSQ